MIKNKIVKPRVRDDVPWPPVNLGSRLHHLRMDTANDNDNALSQQAVCDSLSSTLEYPVSFRKYSEWENNMKEPLLKEIVCLAKVLNTTCDYLLTGTQTEHVDASRKYGLSNQALDVLCNMNHTLHLHQVTSRRYSLLEPPLFHYVHPFGFINALITSPIFCELAFEYTSHIYDNVFLSVIDGTTKETRLRSSLESGNSDDENEFNKQWTEEVEEIRSSADWLGYILEKPKTILKAGEYLLNKKWNELFQLLLSQESIWRNGIAETTSKLDQDRVSDEELERLDWPNKKENQHEKDK